jgi:hypothetical protein
LRTLQRAAREAAHRLHRFDAQAAGAVPHGVDDDARFALRRRKPRYITRDKARAKLQLAARAPHIGLDHEALRAGEIGEIVRLRVRDLHHALCDLALGLNALPDQRGIDAEDSQAPDP